MYDFGELPPQVRKGSPHGLEHREHDLNGEYALLSEYFYYFGNNPEPLPDHLLEIIKRGPGHRSYGNDPYLKPFVDWIESLNVEPNIPHGDPQLMPQTSVSGLAIGIKPRHD